MLVSIPGRQSALRRARWCTLRLSQNDGMQRCDHNRRLCPEPIFWTEFAYFHIRRGCLWQFREWINQLCGGAWPDTNYHSNLSNRVLPVEKSHMDKRDSASRTTPVYEKAGNWVCEAAHAWIGYLTCRGKPHRDGRCDYHLSKEVEYGSGKQPHCGANSRKAKTG